MAFVMGCNWDVRCLEPQCSQQLHGNTEERSVVNGKSKLLKSLGEEIAVWMSHGDQVVELLVEFESLAFTKLPFCRCEAQNETILRYSSTPKLPTPHREVRLSGIFFTKSVDAPVTGRCIHI